MRSGSHVAEAGVLAGHRAAIRWLGVLVLLTGCATERPVSHPESTPSPIALSNLAPGAIVITSVSQAPNITVDAPNDRLESAGEGAATATRNVLNTPNLGHAQLEAVVGVVQFAAVPFAAVYGAVRAHRHRLGPDELRDSEAELRQAMTGSARPEMLRDKVAEAARLRTRRILIAAASPSAVPASRGAISALLELAVEKIDLKASTNAHKEYTLRVEARACLRRYSEEAVLLDRHYRYESGSAFFIDWASTVALKSVVETAYQSIAEQIADEIFLPKSEPPLLIGPGREHSLAPPPAPGVSSFSHSAAHRKVQLVSANTQGQDTAAVRLVYRPALAGRSLDSRRAPPYRFVHPLSRSHGVRTQLLRTSSPVRHRLWALELTNRPAADTVATVAPSNPVPRVTAAIAIFTGKPDDRLRSQSAAPEPGSSPGDITDTEWKMDGLENDRNAVVQVAACVAAVPLGLWEQTVGAVGRRSREKANELTRSLNEIPERTHFDGLMADQVARRLRSQVLNEVQRTDEPLRIALTNPGLPGEAGNVPSPAGPAGEMALEIQVVRAKLLRAHRSSQSMALCVDAQVTVIRSADGQELYSRPVRYRSSPKRLKDWAASDANAFRQELDACSQSTAEALARDLIERRYLVPGTPPKPPVAR